MFMCTYWKQLSEDEAKARDVKHRERKRTLVASSCSRSQPFNCSQLLGGFSCSSDPRPWLNYSGSSGSSCDDDVSDDDEEDDEEDALECIVYFWEGLSSKERISFVET